MSKSEGYFYSFDGMIGCEATVFLRQLADLLPAKRDKDYGSLMSWIHTRLSFAILCAKLCASMGHAQNGIPLGFLMECLLVFY